ncbi:hypothetical protein KO507_07435 [Gilvimarinus agarilyticus]|uniref:hypothetical protein n=1 Tax=Gilvimarinus sp. 2_MG-2023 TaxID=3062666 RepID=UPI001C0A53EC|nr:hypothetical protein [Gilvimarinus sp. 2_MG-2023]MBU2885591.1 hypothetical protein [Gilvimarinus agarilyticus]MDO6570458.1 hypothetical protein [Gilvimarinus sp. 2_MG-2023]
MSVRIILATFIIMLAIIRLCGPQFVQQFSSDELSPTEAFDPLRDLVDLIKEVTRKLGGG